MTFVDIRHYDRFKRKAYSTIVNLMKFYKFVTGDTIHNSLTSTGNPIVQIMHKLLLDTTKMIDDHVNSMGSKERGKEWRSRQRDMLRYPSEFALGMYYNDSAWRDIGNIMLYRLLQHKDELMPLLEAEIKDPRHMYYNLWQSMMTESHDKQKSGVLPEGLMCESETLMVDEIQEYRMNEFINKKKKRKM